MGNWTSREPTEEFIRKYVVTGQICAEPSTDRKFRLGTSDYSETEFLQAQNVGLFAKEDIQKGESIMTSLKSDANLFNDAMMDLRPLLEATTADSFYSALHQCESMYYNKEKAEKNINIVAGRSLDGEYLIYQARKDISKKEELFRCYGFTTWIKEIAESGILSLVTLPGFYRFLKERDWSNDPFELYIRNLVRCEESFLNQAQRKSNQKSLKLFFPRIENI